MSWNFGTRVGYQLLQSIWRSAVVKEHVRNTVVVTRVTPANLPQLGKKFPRKMKRRHKVYYVTENENLKPQGDLQLILLQDVPKIGVKGEIVNVTKQVGRNKLLPFQLATYASPENIKHMADTQIASGMDPKLTASARKTIKYLQLQTLTVEMRRDQDWTLKREHVLHAFKKKLSVMVPDYALTMPEKEIVNEFGKFEVKVTINGIQTVPVAMEIVEAINQSKEAKMERMLAEQENARQKRYQLRSKKEEEF
ncbi:large ribosomal subunit protein bL9m-like isoform X2 [Antedon mediterranea]